MSRQPLSMAREPTRLRRRIESARLCSGNPMTPSTDSLRQRPEPHLQGGGLGRTALTLFGRLKMEAAGATTTVMIGNLCGGTRTSEAKTIAHSRKPWTTTTPWLCYSRMRSGAPLVMASGRDVSSEVLITQTCQTKRNSRESSQPFSCGRAKVGQSNVKSTTSAGEAGANHVGTIPRVPLRG